MAVGVALWALLFAGLALAAAGDLDPDFGTDGRVVTTFGEPLSSGATGMVIQPDGKIVLATRFENAVGPTFTLMRFTPEGILDEGFAGGVTGFDLEGEGTHADAVALQPDGKIVAAGLAQFGTTAVFVVARFNPGGTLDESFDGDGIALVDFAPEGAARAFGVAVQPDGKIVASGSAFDGEASNLAVARLNADGSLDPTFSDDGKVTSDLGGEELGFSLALQGDGRIIIGGVRIVDGERDFLVARYRSDGRLDRSFSGNGWLTTDFGGVEETCEVAVQGDGRIVAAGGTHVGPAYDLVLARYTRAGRLDHSFSGDGKVRSHLGGEEQALGLALPGDGTIVVAGERSVAGQSDFVVARYRRNGSLDPSFNMDGWVATDFGAQEAANAVAVQEDGKIVAAGITDVTPDQVAMARYFPE
jgi:uncharacterized delta-60 repeat protein